MITTASLQEYRVKELAEMARRRGVPGWRGMRKDELVHALVKLAKKLAAARNSSGSSSDSSAEQRVRSKSAPRAAKSVGKGLPKSPEKVPVRTTGDRLANTSTSTSGATNPARPAALPNHTIVASAARSAKVPRPGIIPADASPLPTPPSVVRELQKMYKERGHRLDLSSRSSARVAESTARTEDRIVLMVRDPYWMQAYWEITSRGVSRAQAAMAEWWHTAEPLLRILEIGGENSSPASERVVREIAVHGGVQNWFIDVVDPPHTYRAEIGYRSSESKFFALARSNVVTTSVPARSEAVDHNWSDVAANCDRIFALSGGTSETNSELRELLEQRLRRPMGSPMMTRFGAGAEYSIGRRRDFLFEADAEMIVFGRANPGTHVVLAGEPVKLEEDGSFMVRVSMPERRQVIPLTASSSDGLEQQTIVLAVERNTKVLEHVTRDEADTG